MASASLIQIEPALEDKTTPTLQTYTHQQAHMDSARELTQKDASYTPKQMTRAGYSSGYLSSASNLHSPQVWPKPLSSSPSIQRKELVSDCSNRRVYSTIDSYDGVPYGDIYSRLDHSASSTLTRQTPSHQLPQSSLCPNPPDHATNARSHEPFQHQSTPSRSNFPQQKKMSPKTSLADVLRELKGLEGEIKRWIIKGDQLLKRKEFHAAIPYLEVTILRTQQYPRLQLLLWELLGNALMAVGNPKKASVCYLHHLVHCRALNDFKGMSKAECNLGIAYMQLGLYKLAGRCFLQYLKNCKILQDEWGIQSACSNLGLLSKSLGLKNYRAAIERGENEAAITTLTSCLRRAIIFFKQHLEVVITHEDVEKQGRAYGNIGSCYELLKEYPDAIFYHQKRLEVARNLGDMYSESCTLCNLGNCLRAKGRLKEALEYYQMNLEMAQTLGDIVMEELLHLNLGITYELLNQLENAISSYTLHLGIVVESGDMQKQARGFAVLARLYLETGQITKAHEFYVNLISVFQKQGDHTSLNSARLQLKHVNQLMKQEKKQKSRTVPSRKRHRVRGYTVSRANNFHQEIKSHASYSQSPRDLRDKMATWSVRGSRPSQRASSLVVVDSSLTSESSTLDPILALADLPPSWEGHPGGLGYNTSNLARYQSTSFTSSTRGGNDNTLLYNSSYDSALDENWNMSLCYSAPHNHQVLGPNTNSSHYAKRRSIYGFFTHTTTSHSGDDLTIGQSTALPSPDTSLDRGTHDGGSNFFEYSSPSTSLNEMMTQDRRPEALPYLSYTYPDSFLEERTHNGSIESEEELTDEEVDHNNMVEVDHMLELERAGLELVRAGLELAGYEDLKDLGIDKGADKEWEQWKQIRDDSGGYVFGSMISVAGTHFRKKPHKKQIRHTVSTPAIHY